MPKKPKHIQDKVNQLVEEDHTTKEIIAIIKKEYHTVSPTYISGRRKKIRKLDEKKGDHEAIYKPKHYQGLFPTTL